MQSINVFNVNILVLGGNWDPTAKKMMHLLYDVVEVHVATSNPQTGIPPKSAKVSDH